MFFAIGAENVISPSTNEKKRAIMSKNDEIRMIIEVSMNEDKKTVSPLRIVLGVLQGMLIGLGAVLPGISGGVLCVVFGIYKPLMELISNPFKTWRKHLLNLLPVLIGVVLGFLGVAKLLGVLLDKYPNPSICLFVGLIVGLLPSLFREAGEKGRTKGSFISLGIAFVLVMALLLGYAGMNMSITPNFAWYLFCGFCVALSIIAPGMSFSTLTMPLGLYQPLVDGIGSLHFSVLIPCGVGAVLTVILFAKAVNYLFDRHHSVAFHAILGIVIAATIMTVVNEVSFDQSIGGYVVCAVCFVVGAVGAYLLDRFNTGVRSKEE